MATNTTGNPPSSGRGADNLAMDRPAIASTGADAARQTCEELYCKYNALFNYAPIGCLVVGHDGTLQEVNLSASVLLDAPRSRLIGRRFLDFVHPDDRDQFLIQKRQCPESLASRTFEVKIKRMDGRLFDARIQIQSFCVNARDEPQYSVSLMDISEQTELSTTVALQQQCLELAVTAPDMTALLTGCVRLVKAFLGCDAVGIRLRDHTGCIPYQAFDGFDQQFYESESLLCLKTDHCMCVTVINGAIDPGQPCYTPYGSFYTNHLDALLGSLPATGRKRTRSACHAQGYASVALIPFTFEDAIQGLIHAADRRANRFSLRVVEVLEFVGVRLGLAVQRFVLQERLLQSRRTLDELSKHLLTMQEVEQRRIAMELHDGCGQNLNVLKLRLKAFQKKMPGDAASLAGECDQLMALVDGIIDEIRNIAHGLKPSALEALGLVPATRQMIRDYATQNNVVVERRIDLLGRIDNPTVQVCLYRIFQEALTNIHKHAKATWILFAVRQEDGSLHITIKDNGVGFDDRRILDGSGDRRGMGLHAMALRCRMIGARLEIDSQPGTGSRLRILLPCPALNNPE